MIPVYQTIDTKEYGNCLEACLASLFHNDIGDWPALDSGKKWPLWIKPINDYLIANYQCYLLCIESDNPKEDFKGYYIVVGENQGALATHAMLGYNGKIIFDPSGMRLDFELLKYFVIVKLFT